MIFTSKRFSLRFLHMLIFILTATACMVQIQAAESTADLSKASWVWAKDQQPAQGSVSFFRKTFALPGEIDDAVIAMTADNGYELFVNTNRVAGQIAFGRESWASVELFPIKDLLHQGDNVIAIRGECLGGSAGVIAAISIRLTDGQIISLQTDESWRASGTLHDNWIEPDHDDSTWAQAAIVAEWGANPWGALSTPNDFTDPTTLTMSRVLPGGVDLGPPPKGFSEPPANYQWAEGIVFIENLGDDHSTPIQRSKFYIDNTSGFYEYDTPAPAASGSKLMSMIPARPGSEPKLLLDAGTGRIGSPICSYDGSEVLFSYAPEGEKFFHVYRIGIDGAGLEQLTSGPWHDYDPAILADGRVAFASTRMGSREEYHANTSRNLMVLDRESGGLYPLTYHIVADGQPRVMSDGRIAFVRNDNFMERAKVETRIHAVRPDGTGGSTIVGPDRKALQYDRFTGAESQSNWLRYYGFTYPSPLPDGRVACVSRFGPIVTKASLSETIELEKMACDVNVWDMSPLPDGRLIVTTPQGQLGLVDSGSGFAVKLLGSPGSFYHSASFCGTRPKPQELAQNVTEEMALSTEKTGYLMCQRVTATKQTNADWGRVKAVRVIEGRPMTLRSAKHQYDHIGVEAVELGTAPLAADGSFFVEVPADRAIAIQMIDAEGRAVVNEMSWIYVRPNEVRSCTGCHDGRQAAPRSQGNLVLAAMAPPIKMLGSGDPHRFRGNNAANGGMLNLQFDRFREVAAMNSYSQEVLPEGFEPAALAPGRGGEVARLIAMLESDDVDVRIAAAQRLTVFRDREAASPLAAMLDDRDERVRLSAAMAMAACGTAESLDPLCDLLDDRSPTVAMAASMALEHLTGEPIVLNQQTPATRSEGKAAWEAFLGANPPALLEEKLIARLKSDDPIEVHLAIESLGHIGDTKSREALRTLAGEYTERGLRELQATIRALGMLDDEESIPLLQTIMLENIAPLQDTSGGSHEFGWAARPVFLAAVCAEALGRIGTPEAESVLIDIFSQLKPFNYYSYATADHRWLEGSHSSPIHWRIIESLDAIGSTRADEILPELLRSVPIDSDRGILLENDSYETTLGRLILRSSCTDEVVDGCLAVLGDKNAACSDELREAISWSPPAVSTGILCPESRAAQLLSCVCCQSEYSPQVRAMFDRYRSEEPSRRRSWVCFMLVRTLGRLHDIESVPTLISVLDDDPTEASFGIADPPNVFLSEAMSPAYRAAAADALGRIGDLRATPALLRAVVNYENVMETRDAAAGAIRRMADPAALETLEEIAPEYPEVVTGRKLREALFIIENE